MITASQCVPHTVQKEVRADDSIILRSGLELGPVARNTGEWLHHWAEKTPNRIFIAERNGPGWREISYEKMLFLVRSVAAGLLARGIQPGKTIVVLSGPSIDHAILTLAAQYIGAVTVPLAEQYSLIKDAHKRLRYCVEKVNADMVYTADAKRFSDALSLDVFDAIPKVASANASEGIEEFSTYFTKVDQQVDAAYKDVASDTVAKILFTSGSTSDPKAVPQTHHMMCVNQAQNLAILPMLRAKAHKMLDWKPWNHVFAGSANFNMMLSNGGALYLDDGKPVGPESKRTIQNMSMHQSTLSFDVPVAHTMHVNALKADPELKRKYFAALDAFFYAGASLPADVWQAIEQMSIEESGEPPLMLSGWGLTETAPTVLNFHEKGASSGLVGVPVPGVEIKLIPLGNERYDVRVRGPNVFKGYLDDEKRTAEAFDKEGFFISGDAMRFVNSQDVSRGMRFDGRIGEDFKLFTGTWVQASILRLNALSEFGNLVADIVVVGEGRAEVGLLIFPPGKMQTGTKGDVVLNENYQRQIAEVLGILATRASGSSQRIARALVMAEPPDHGAGEVTAKGSLNVQNIVMRRSDLLDRLYEDTDTGVIHVQG